MSQSTKSESIFNHQSDEFVIQNLKNLFHKEKKLNEQILIHLQEVQNRRLYAKWGYFSLFEFLVKYFHQSETSVYQRIKSIKFIQSVTEAKNLLVTGQVTMSTLSEAQSVIQQIEKHTHQKVDTETKTKMLEAIKGKSKKESQKQLSTFNPFVEIPKNKEIVITDKLTKLEIVIDERTQNLLNDVKSLLSHEIHDGDLSLIFKKTLKMTCEILSKKKGISRSSSENINYSSESNHLSEDILISSNESLCSTDLTPSRDKINFIKSQNLKKSKLTTDGGVALRNADEEMINSSRYISVIAKKEIFARAQNCCEFVSRDGIKCQSQYQLQIDHVVPFSQGGKSSTENLQLLCLTHNLFKGNKLEDNKIDRLSNCNLKLVVIHLY